MAHTAQIAPFVQIADITGQWGVSFLIVLINTMLLETILIPGKSIIFKWIFTLIILIGSFIYGIYTTNVEIPWEKSITVLMVQQNADSWVSGKEIESIKKGQDLTREALSKIILHQIWLFGVKMLSAIHILKIVPDIKKNQRVTLLHYF